MARAPGRVNLIGDHTDYTGGLVFPMAIDRWTEIDGSPADRIRLVSDDEPEPVDIPAGVVAADVEHVEPRWGRFVAAVAAELGNGQGFDGRVRTTIPVGAGLSSSASLEVAVALALGFDGTPIELAQLARRAEHAATGVPTGIMDQLCIASAQHGHATLIDCHTLDVTAVPVPDDVAIIVQFVTHRTLEGSAYTDRVRECTRAEAVVGPLRGATLDDLGRIDDELVRRRARHVVTENARVVAFADALERGDYVAAGEQMVASHRSLRDDFAVSTPMMDRAVREVVDRPGVFGARMTGGGFGGCVVTLCRPDATVAGHRVRPVDGATLTRHADGMRADEPRR
ncbi:MAG: galactokinase family protein [Ilumatobacteraceae bacterium]